MGKPGNSKKISSPVSNASVGNAGPVPTGRKVTFNSQGMPVVTPQNNNPAPVTQNPVNPTPQQNQPPVQLNLPIQQNIQGMTGKDQNPNFSNTLNLNQMHQDQTQKNINALLAEKMYMTPDPMRGSMYSFGQDMNYQMEMGNPLTGNQKFVANSLENAMMPIGQGTTLTRYAHQDFLQRQLGIQNYQGMSDAQLSQALVGKTFTMPSMTSTTANAQKMMRSNASALTEKEVQLNIHAHGSTRAFAIDPGTGQDELLLSQANKWEITGAKFPKTASGKRQRGRWKASYYDKVEIDVDVWYE